jgi:phosphoribosyl-ATP pyrophosphohydrolase/phosphoribosyl-AMP cyclohydrolase
MNEIKIEWEKSGGLIPAVIQDFETNEVLMLGYMNKEALELTKKTGFVHYYSRSKQRIWKKGETSGHTQEVKEMLIDCDNDTLLIKVKQNGVACHTGRKSCFFTNLDNGKIVAEVEIKPEYNFIDTLYHTLLERKSADAKSSYVASLYHKGENSILKKVVEEAGELCFAVKDDDKNEIIYEAADLLFHSMVALAYKNIHPEAILNELKRREGVSGIEEKNSRNK